MPVAASDLAGLLDFAQREKIDLTVVGPEAPLVAGIADLFESKGLRVAGPSRQAAALEGSKVFAKEFLLAHDIPTAASQVYRDADSAEADLAKGLFDYPVVLKADGLAAGKGVIICHDLEESRSAVDVLMRERRFGDAGNRVLIEEFLRGEEASFMVFTDGSRILPMVASQDHKAAYDGDKGPNTGGMGAYSDDTILSDRLKARIMSEIVEPTVAGMARRGTPFKGILYAGLMLTDNGPKVLEFNVRFGDPEAQAVLPRLDSDLLEVLDCLAAGDLSGQTLQWSPDPVVCVVLAAQGYPGSHPKGTEISGLDLAGEGGGTLIFHSGTAWEEGRLVTAGGRVLGVTARSSSLDGAIMSAYEAVNKIYFSGMFCRRDIAAKGLARAEAARLSDDS